MKKLGSLIVGGGVRLVGGEVECSEGWRVTRGDFPFSKVDSQGFCLRREGSEFMVGVVLILGSGTVCDAAVVVTVHVVR